MPTHAFARQGPGGTTAASKTQIGTDIIMPATGPWTIFGLWGQVVKGAGAHSEGAGGQLIMDAVSGDLSPDPAPGKYPLIGSPAAASANFHIAQVPLNIWPVRWEASGKATVRLSYLNQLASTVACEVACGIIFGKEIPEPRPLVFCDSVYSAFASAAEQSIGTITLSEKATRIVGILADLNHGDAVTAAEETIATIRLASDDIKMPPAQYPCIRAFDAADGTHVGAPSTPRADFIPVDIPVEGGARINVYATTSISVTGNAEVLVYLAYE